MATLSFTRDPAGKITGLQTRIDQELCRHGALSSPSFPEGQKSCRADRKKKSIQSLKKMLP